MSEPDYTREDFARLHRAHCATADELAAANARIAKLEVALGPWARAAAILPKQLCDSDEISVRVPVADLRRSATVLRSKP